MKWLALATTVFAVSLALRASGPREVPPFDDLYHLQRMEAFPRVPTFDPGRGERGAFCPWPPLYDFLGGALLRLLGRRIVWMAPFGFSLFAATFGVIVARRIGMLSGATAGFGLALSPYLIDVSQVGALDHHWVEPMLVLAIVAATLRRNGIALGIAIAAAMLVQTALLPAAALAFVAFFLQAPRQGAIGFAIAAAVVAADRLLQPPGYPDNAWFLGWPHVWLFLGAATACCLVPRRSRAVSIAAGIAAASPALPAVLAGLHFFGGDPWLQSIAEFQPMFRDPASLGTDLANLTGGALLAFFVVRRQPVVGGFSILYLLLALSSHRFLVPGIPLFVLCGAIAASRLATAATLLPPLFWLAATFAQPWTADRMAAVIRLPSLPPGRVLAPWSYGHAIHVLRRMPVMIDNFGSMPDEVAFANANQALLQTDPAALRAWCLEHGVRYLFLPDAATRLRSTAACVPGIDPDAYTRTALARRTVWWRLRYGATFRGFRRVAAGDIEVWEIE